ncbi:MAG: glycerophosphodiester phosphodiesterase [Firmicutes bacterium]|nr:glycerophosphodiester phosphodiesterase [Bacillota bacterium]
MEKKQILDELLTWRYAHRGFHDKPAVPENSMLAFRRAASEGFGIELDVHLTKDKKLAVIHDSSLQRTCGIDLNIEEITLEEAQVYFLEKSEEVIPEFEDVLEVVSGKVPLIVEIKSAGGNDRELTDAVMTALEGYDGLYCIESFSPSVVGYLRKAYPDVVRGQLAGCLNKNFDKKNAGGSGGEPTLTRLQDFLLKNLWVNIAGRPDFVAYCYEDRDMRAFVNFKGAKFLWTIRSYDDLQACEKSGAAGIFEQFNPKDYE